MLRQFIYLVVACYAAGLKAEWVIDPEGSYVGFASVKNELIAENHSFTALSGTVSDAGQARVEIALTSVDTLIPIRNERIQSMLFETERFPIAVASADITIADFTSMANGESKILPIELTVDLHGNTLTKAVLVKVSRAGEGIYDVTSLGPLVIHASQFALAAGIEALRKIAGLQSIDPMVPVAFDLRVVRAKTD